MAHQSHYLEKGKMLQHGIDIPVLQVNLADGEDFLWAAHKIRELSEKLGTQVVEVPANKN